MSLPTCTFVGLGDGLRLFRSFSSLLGGLDLERERLLLSCLRREGLGDPEELLELELREVLELPERLEAEEELEPLLEPVLELDPELEVELERDLVLLLPLEALRLLRVLSRPRSFSPDSLVDALSLDRSFDFSSDLSLRLVGEGALVLDFLLFSLSPSKLFFFNPDNSISPSEASKAAPNGPHLSQISLLTPRFSEPIPNRVQ